MHETRYDWLADRWVIFAPNREHRPNEYCETKKPAEPFQRSASCPFCVGSEAATPEPSLVLPTNDLESTSFLTRNERRVAKDDWKVRVVPNKFPAISNGKRNGHSHCNAVATSAGVATIGTSEPSVNSGEGVPRRRCFMPHMNPSAQDLFAPDSAIQNVATILGSDTSHLFQREVVSGIHEVIIESPHHIDSLSELPDEQIELILTAYRQRLSHWRSESGLQYAVVFKNYGADAGASLSHTHSQLMCLDFIPSNVDWTYRRLSEYRRQYNSCYYCQIIVEELKSRERIVMETEHFIVVCPFASRFPYCYSIIPRQHRAHYDEIDHAELVDLSTTLRKSLRALEACQPLAAYNFILQTAPFQSPDFAAHHWRLRVIPRLNKVAGFEWGSDCFINTVLPEVAAQNLKNNWPSSS